jgi:hypothetical protein
VKNMWMEIGMLGAIVPTVMSAIDRKPLGEIDFFGYSLFRPHFGEEGRGRRNWAFPSRAEKGQPANICSNKHLLKSGGAL